MFDSFASSSSMNSRERMRLAKLGAMQAEQLEDAVRREKRRASRRGSELSVSSLRASTLSLASSSSSLRPAPAHSILRRPSSPAIVISAPEPSIDDFTPRTTIINRPSSASSSLTRRSSRVRFSEVILPPAHSSPAPSLSSRQTSTESLEVITPPMEASPPIFEPVANTKRASEPEPSAYTSEMIESPISLDTPKTPTLRRGPSIEGLRADLESHIVSTALELDRPASFASSSRSSMMSDQFSLDSSRSSLCPQVVNQQHPDNEQAYRYDAFSPQPLPYPRLSKLVSRFSFDSLASSARSFSTSASPSSRSSIVEDISLEDMLQRDSLAPIAHPSVSSSTKSTSLMDMLNRPSLSPSATKAWRQTRLATNHNHNNNNSAALGLGIDTDRLSFTSWMTTSTPTSSKSNSFALSASRGVHFIPAFESQGEGQGSTLSTPTQASIEANRQAWTDESIGFSPRSGPSPIPEDVVEMVPPIPLSADAAGTTSLGSSPPAEGLSNHMISRDGEVDVLSPSQRDFVDTATHRRAPSSLTLEDVFSFPVPPERDTAAPAQEEDSPDMLEDAESSHAVAASQIAEHYGTSEFHFLDTVPGSPTLESLMTQASALRRSSGSHTYPLAKSTESDDELDTPTTVLALRSGIISPRSSLLNGPLTPRRGSRTPTRRSPTSVTRQGSTGWSGSESEEEEWINTVRSVAQRRSSSQGLSTPTQAKAPTPTPTPNRFSTASEISISISEMSSSSCASELLTPQPSITTFRHLDLHHHHHHHSEHSQVAALPEPTKKVEGWGVPEVLLDSFETPTPILGSRSRALSAHLTPTMNFGFRVASQGEGEGEGEGEGYLLNETMMMPEWQSASASRTTVGRGDWI